MCAAVHMHESSESQFESVFTHREQVVRRDGVKKTVTPGVLRKAPKPDKQTPFSASASSSKAVVSDAARIAAETAESEAAKAEEEAARMRADAAFRSKYVSTGDGELFS